VVNDRAICHVRRRSLQIVVVTILLIMALISIGTIWAVHQVSLDNDRISDHEASDATLLHANAVAQCDRVNELRAQANERTRLYFTIVTHAVDLIENTHIDHPAEKHLMLMISARNRMRVYPPTDCHQAVAHPNTYRRPAPILLTSEGH